MQLSVRREFRRRTESKGYGFSGMPGRGEKTFYVLYVRGNKDYGKNDFVNNADGTVTDYATGLTWQQKDSGDGMYWEDALSYCENLELAGRDDWRLPSAKELQSILDYTRSPGVLQLRSNRPRVQGNAYNK